MVALPFLKKKEQPPAKTFVPIERVKELASRGFPEPEMFDVLRKEGYTPEAIDNALTASLKMNISEPSVAPAEYEQPQPAPQPQHKAEQLPTLEELVPQRQDMPQMPEQSLNQEYYTQQYPAEDYIDYVVQARVSEVNERLNEFSIRHQEMEKRIGVISDQLTQMMNTRSSEQQQILTRIDGLGETANDVDIKVGSLEKIFRETLPALIESVRALSDLVQRLKREA